jgi:hypothetical protein
MLYIGKNKKKEIAMVLEGRYIRQAEWGYHPSFQNSDIVMSWG